MSEPSLLTSVWRCTWRRRQAVSYPLWCTLNFTARDSMKPWNAILLSSQTNGLGLGWIFDHLNFQFHYVLQLQVTIMESLHSVLILYHQLCNNCVSCIQLTSRLLGKALWYGMAMHTIDPHWLVTQGSLLPPLVNSTQDIHDTLGPNLPHQNVGGRFCK